MPTSVSDEVDEAIRTLIEGASEPVHVVGPSGEVIEELIDVAVEVGDVPAISLLAAEDTLKDVLDDFIVASHAADLIEDDVLGLKTVESPPAHNLFVTEDAVTALVVAGESVAALETEEGDFVADAFGYYETAYDDAEEYSLRTPPLSRVRETLEEDIGPDAREDFDAVLASMETARGDGEGLDEVTLSLLVAARNEELLYDISKWGEDVGIASKATFSRTKTTLEEMGLIDTEKVPIEVGRPRLRLLLGHEKLEDASVDELASVAQSLMSAS